MDTTREGTSIRGMIRTQRFAGREVWQKSQFLPLPWGQLSPCLERVPDQLSRIYPFPCPISPAPGHMAWSQSPAGMWYWITEFPGLGTSLSLMPKLNHLELRNRGCRCLSVLRASSPVHRVFMQLAESRPYYEPTQVLAGHLGRFQTSFLWHEIACG